MRKQVYILEKKPKGATVTEAMVKLLVPVSSDVEPIDVSDKTDKGGYEGTAQDIVDLIPTYTEGQNITIDAGVIDVDIPEGESFSSILGTTGNTPEGITIDTLGNIYTANSLSNNVTKITPSGVSSVLGTTGNNPRGIVIDTLGNIYTTNLGSNNVTKITPSGVSSILGTTGNYPRGIVIDTLGNIYTANNNSNSVTKITPSGVSSVLGTTGNNPNGITIDSSGNIYTANSLSNNVTKITPSGVSSILGTTGNVPFNIAIDSSGNIYTTNSNSNSVTKITPSGVSSILGTTGNNPRDIAIDTLGNIYTTNNFSNSVTKITPSGVSSILGTTGNNPTAITIDTLGNIYTANSLSNNVTKITINYKTVLAVDESGNIIRIARGVLNGLAEFNKSVKSIAVSGTILTLSFQDDSTLIATLPSGGGTLDISQNVEADKESITKWYSAKAIYNWVKLQMLNIVQVKETRASNTRKFWDGTQTQKDAIVTKDPNTYYFTFEP